MSSYLRNLFGRGGYLDEVFGSYEPRRGQIELAVAIDAAIASERHLLGEGPCGTGKGVAYLAPAIERVWDVDDRRVVVCTETIALQEQLVDKDLPLLRKALPFDFEFVLLKGRNNYLCLRRLNQIRPWEVTGKEPPPLVDEVEAWATETKTGDRSELSFKPRGDLWEGFSSTSDDCIGKRCAYYGMCYANMARARAFEAKVVVTNFHMLMANIQYGGAVLPPFQILVCDEAHKLAGVARDCLGFSVSYYSVRRVVQWLKRQYEEELARCLDRAADKLFDKIADYARSARYHQQLRQPGFVDGDDVLRLLQAAWSMAQHMAEDEELTDTTRGEAQKLGERCEKLIMKIDVCIHQSDDRNVYWLEEHSKKKVWYSMEARPIEVGGILHEHLFGAVPTAVLVSATMTTGGNFSFLRRELGVPSDAMEVIGESAFDWHEQGRFIIPQAIPDPPTGHFATFAERQKREQEWGIAVAESFEEVIRAARGRTLGLFTSRRNMDLVAKHLLLSGELPGPLLVQEPGATLSKLVVRFREEPESTLLGVASFWTGLDVPGDTLSVVFIDRIPFPVPSDPVTSAICDRLDKKHGAWSGFNKFMIPMAIMQLRQGVGRLIRCQTDRGVVVVADRRLLTKAYSKQFFVSLPDMQVLRNVEDIGPFLFGEEPWASQTI